MAQSAHLTYTLLLVAATLPFVRAARGWAGRPNPLVTLTAGGLVGLACALAVTAPPG